MKLRHFSFIGMVVLVIGGLQTLSFVNKPPAMPKDIHHDTVSRLTLSRSGMVKHGRRIWFCASRRCVSSLSYPLRVAMSC